MTTCSDRPMATYGTVHVYLPIPKILRENALPENLNVHSLRHTNASMLIAQGMDIRTMAGLLGHSQLSTTLSIYSHAFDKNKRLTSQKPAR